MSTEEKECADAGVWSVLSQLDDISSLKEEQSTALKAFWYSWPALVRVWWSLAAAHCSSTLVSDALQVSPLTQIGSLALLATCLPVTKILNFCFGSLTQKVLPSTFQVFFCFFGTGFFPSKTFSLGFLPRWTWNRCNGLWLSNSADKKDSYSTWSCSSATAATSVISPPTPSSSGRDNRQHTAMLLLCCSTVFKATPVTHAKRFTRLWRSGSAT